MYAELPPGDAAQNQTLDLKQVKPGIGRALVRRAAFHDHETSLDHG